jgi:formylmethanofuran:tetrahydromethanopterin formyltransferase
VLPLPEVEGGERVLFGTNTGAAMAAAESAVDAVPDLEGVLGED